MQYSVWWLSSLQCVRHNFISHRIPFFDRITDTRYRAIAYEIKNTICRIPLFRDLNSKVDIIYSIREFHATCDKLYHADLWYLRGRGLATSWIAFAHIHRKSGLFRRRSRLPLISFDITLLYEARYNISIKKYLRYFLLALFWRDTNRRITQDLTL